MTGAALSTEKLKAVSDLIRLPRQYGTLLVLWPTLWSLFIASNGRPSIKHLAIFLLGTFLMRSAGCAINDVADRNFDNRVERTKTRPVASGRLSAKEALFVFASLALLAFVLVLFLNRLTIMLSFFGIFFAVAYPFVKRVSHFPQTFLGVAFGWGAIMAWSAVRGSLGTVPLLIFLANIHWSMAYDTIYALMDMEDDLKVGVKSTAIFFGNRVYTALYALYAAVSVLLTFAGVKAGLGAAYYAGVAIGLASFIWIVYSMKTGKAPVQESAFKGFIANAVVGGIILIFIIIDTNF